MSPDTPPDLVETFNSLEEALEEFRLIKKQLQAGAAQELKRETAATLAGSAAGYYEPGAPGYTPPLLRE